MHLKQAVRTAAVIAAASLLCGAAAPEAGQGAAQSFWDRCPHGTYCLFTEPKGNGKIHIIEAGPVPQLGWPAGNNTAGVWNRTGRAVECYPEPGFQGVPTCYTNPYDYPGDIDKEASSVSSTRPL